MSTTAITSGVKVSVTTNYQEEYSSPSHAHYVFSYRINIENNSQYTIKLLKRHWHIFDATGSKKEVEGDGVVGQQPIIESGESHEYVSGCNFKTGLGKMNGFYQFQRLIDKKLFNVEIPEFVMATLETLN
ncbi:MAG: Co2+/Mg2+ efflux protein ApaG [Cyclobacteriaceae bacterium]